LALSSAPSFLSFLLSLPIGVSFPLSYDNWSYTHSGRRQKGGSVPRTASPQFAQQVNEAASVRINVYASFRGSAKEE